MILGYKEFVRLGPIATIFIVLGFSYSITKHELLGIRAIINRIAAYGLTVGGVGFSITLAYSLISNEVIRFISLVIIGIIWTLYGEKIRQILQTTADRLWVSDWYNPQEVITSITTKLSPLFDRNTIIHTVALSMEETLQLKDFFTLISEIDEEGGFYQYRLCNKEDETIHTFSTPEPFVQTFSNCTHPMLFHRLPPSIQKLCSSFGISKYSAFLPLYSPEGLEGLIIVGQRASEMNYSSKDMELFEVVIATVGVFLDRMRPYESIQNEFNKNQKKLYDLERKVAQSEKIASLALAVKEYNHELKTPLSITRMLIDQLPPDHHLDGFKIEALEQIDRAISIINQSLSLSSTKQRVESELAIRDAISPALKLIPSQITLKKDIPDQLPLIKGVIDDLVIVFTNLVKNACEAMSLEGQISITVYQTIDEIVVEISDTGYGIPKADIPKVLDPFFVGDKKKTKGHGLGLSIVFRIVREHLGHVTIESEEGVGTKITVKLPKNS